MPHRAIRTSSVAVLTVLALVTVAGPAATFQDAGAAASSSFQKDLARIRRDMDASNPADVTTALKDLEPYLIRLVKEDAEAVVKAMRGWGELVIENSSGTLIHKRRRMARESNAIATLRNMVSAQAQFQHSAAVDMDGDGRGEYGTIGEMAGHAVLRGQRATLEPPILSPRFVVADRRATRGSYHIQVFLPDGDGKGVEERTKGGARIGLHGDAAVQNGEHFWCAYAWPADPRDEGRAFFVNQQGEILICDNRHVNGGRGYRGDEGPKPDAAFRRGGKPGVITGKLDPGKKARDGGVWRVLR